MAIIVMNRNLYFLGAFAITLLIDLEKTMTFMDDLVMALIMYISVVCKVNLQVISLQSCTANDSWEKEVKLANKSKDQSPFSAYQLLAELIYLMVSVTKIMLLLLLLLLAVVYWACTTHQALSCDLSFN